MSRHKIIFISQEISPYLTGTPNGKFGRDIPQAMSSRKHEVRTFMPDFGEVNERRNQLHEVIRLSGLNIPIGDNDHPLVVKVASMQPSRVQVYFIDSDDYFQKLDSDTDPFGCNREDNDERTIFFAHGTLETVKKLRWEPEIMQVSGWSCAFVPLYLKSIHKESPAFHDTKVVYVVLPGETPSEVNGKVFDKLAAEGAGADEIGRLKELPLDGNFFHKAAAAFADKVVFRGVEPDADLLEYCSSIGVPVAVIPADGDSTAEFEAIYDELAPKTK